MTQTGIGAALATIGYDGNQWFNAQRTRYYYDAADRLRYVLRADGAVEERRYDARGNVVHTIAYAQAANLAAAGDMATLEAQLNRNDLDNTHTRQIYDRAGQLRFQVNAAGLVTELDYDTRGNLSERRTYTALPVDVANAAASVFTVEGMQGIIARQWETQLGDRPLAAWKLDETQGQTLVDASGNNHNGLYSTDVSRYTQDALGTTGSGMSFWDGMSARVAGAGLQPNRLTLETWVQLTQAPVAGQWTSLISTTENGGWSLGVDETGHLRFRVYIAGSLREVSGRTLAVNQSYQLAATFDGRHVNLYLNGDLEGSLDLGGTFDITYAPLANGETVDIFIGAEPNSVNEAVRYQPAILDDVALYAIRM
jgi:YD repeat-containing protein